jgi:hypothetical protein
LTDAALAILRPLLEARVSDYVFPGETKRGPTAPLSVMAMTMQMRRMEVGRYTPHGFRSAFRDWAGDQTSFPREVAEAALAHKVGDSVENAYRRSDALEKRRKLMSAWSNYLDAGKARGNLRLVGGNHKEPFVAVCGLLTAESSRPILFIVLRDIWFEDHRSRLVLSWL